MAGFSWLTEVGFCSAPLLSWSVIQKPKVLQRWQSAFSGKACRPNGKCSLKSSETAAMRQEKTNGFAQKKHHQIQMERCSLHTNPKTCSSLENIFLLGSSPSLALPREQGHPHSHLPSTSALPSACPCAMGIPVSALSSRTHLLPLGNRRQPPAVQCSEHMSGASMQAL